MAIEIILYILIVATSVPAGLLLAWLCDDELKKGKRYFRVMIYLLLLAMFGLLLFYRNISAILAVFYMILVFWIMILKGKKKFEKRERK